MVKAYRKLVIDNEAKQQLRELYLYIKGKSVQYAEKVRNGLLKSFKAILKHPEKYPPDKYRLPNEGSYRA